MASASARDDMRGSNRLKAQLAAKKNSRHGECQSESGGRILPAPAQQPRSAKSNDEHQDGENRRTAQGGESLRRQIENVRHREAVGIQVVILQQVRDAALRRNIERRQDQIAQANRGHHSDHGESGLQARQPAVARFFGIVSARFPSKTAIAGQAPKL